MESETGELTVDSLKEAGNNAMKEEKFKEAALHYTEAIKFAPKNPILYSNRSVAHLMLKHYYLAICDAKQSIELNPSWPKGYFRKGQVELATHQYTDACESFREALKRSPQDPIIYRALSNSEQELLRQQKLDKDVPWVGAGVGIIIGAAYVLSKMFYKNSFQHPLFMCFTTIFIAMVGRFIAKTIRVYMKNQEKKLLEPPDNLLNCEENEKAEEQQKKKTPRYTKSQARMRYKKGKA
ncbi:hypothetical protein ABEB36_003732 [Hypothenemus hampei]|uniref:Uncharacterized protein n=1 Tax=Hypothenemus hampei TaxID=57062 RepID=A0ABD1F0Z7_HYPHA